MCGITGIITKNGLPCDEKLLHKVNDSIKHRGPDGDGFYIYKNLGFGHRRLAIIDLTDSGKQPMELNDRYFITYNGEIYNYIELKSELVKAGITFKTVTDTEVILKSFEYWGEDCVNHFNGMWAFAIFDKLNATVFISRDRFGVKPLYYINTPEKFAFGSEIKQLLGFGMKAKVNKQVLSDYFYLGYSNHTPHTFFEGIYQLEPGCNLTLSLSDVNPTIYRYYDLKVDMEVNKLNKQEAIDFYISKLNDGINIRLRSDVVVGSCLSGGLDSSYIASYASSLHAAKSNDQFKAITARSLQSDNDESLYAKIVADHANLEWHVASPDTSDYYNVLDKVIEIQEEPFGGPSIIMQYYVFKMAKDNNCIVMLDGQGGDETLLGYERYYASYFNSLRFMQKLKLLFSASKNSKLKILDLLKYILYFNSYFVRRRTLLKKNSYLKNDLLKLFNSDLLRKIINKSKNIYDLQLFDIQSHQLRTLLMYEDKNSMSHSIETRLPFLDYRAVEAAVSINCDFKISDGWTKYPLRKKGADNKVLPLQIAWRQNKIGFEAPSKLWLSNKEENIKLFQASPFLNTIIDFTKIKVWDDATYWKIMNVFKWQQIFDVEY
ncbi:MAG: asparagine synthase (glutamine-hydrolyzing) [Chitinophagaceae bacterium]|nr:asparagine synthase (glutamine-hydrolyzing) [Chitinophagaceae bacterium]MCA6511674.1 asparagine synthase (glutamine-hydrolyzing) [Chitinophagaceae bacterium]